MHSLVGTLHPEGPSGCGSNALAHSFDSKLFQNGQNGHLDEARGVTEGLVGGLLVLDEMHRIGRVVLFPSAQEAHRQVLLVEWELMQQHLLLEDRL